MSIAQAIEIDPRRDDKDRPLREDIRRLGRIPGDTVCERWTNMLGVDEF